MQVEVQIHICVNKTILYITLICSDTKQSCYNINIKVQLLKKIVTRKTAVAQFPNMLLTESLGSSLHRSFYFRSVLLYRVLAATPHASTQVKILHW